MFLINFPLMLVPFVVYNFFLAATAVNPWEDIIFRMDMMSGGSFSLTAGEGLILASLVLLLGEMAKAAHNSALKIERILSIAVLLAFVMEFMLEPRAANATFLMLGTIAFIGVIGGYLVSPRHAASPITFDP